MIFWFNAGLAGINLTLFYRTGDLNFGVLGFINVIGALASFLAGV